MASPRQRTLPEKVAAAMLMIDHRKRGISGTTEKAFYRMGALSREARCDEAELLIKFLNEIGVKLEITNNFPV